MTYCEPDGFEHVLHPPEEPTELYVPALYPVMYWFAAHVILFPNCVSAVGEHTTDTYCEPADGLEHIEHDPAVPTALYAPALYPDVY